MRGAAAGMRALLSCAVLQKLLRRKILDQNYNNQNRLVPRKGGLADRIIQPERIQRQTQRRRDDLQRDSDPQPFAALADIEAVVIMDVQYPHERSCDGEQPRALDREEQHRIRAFVQRGVPQEVETVRPDQIRRRRDDPDPDHAQPAIGICED